MAEASTFFNEGNMEIIQNTFNEEFKKQGKKHRNLISANFKITILKNSLLNIKNRKPTFKNLEKNM